MLIGNAIHLFFPPPVFFSFPGQVFHHTLLAIASAVGPPGRDGPSRAAKGEINQNDNCLKDTRYL